jgi:hypothetical protein
MIECVIDTHVLSDLLIQYNSGKPNEPVIESFFLTKKIRQILNRCIVSDGFDGVVVASTFAFIEILNQFSLISKNQFSISKIVGLLNQPPEWFIIEPFSIETTKKLIEIPKFNLRGEKIELADAIHVATAMQRGPNSILATHDGILTGLNFNKLQLMHIA